MLRGSADASGATSSGKTTLVKNIEAILRPGRITGILRTQVLHQDDFTFPQDRMPFNEELNVVDWDDPDRSVRSCA